jgi:hypothetical protein
MKLFKVAFAGLLGLAGLVAGGPTDKSYTPHYDNRLYT